MAFCNVCWTDQLATLTIRERDPLYGRLQSFASRERGIELQGGMDHDVCLPCLAAAMEAEIAPDDPPFEEHPLAQGIQSPLSRFTVSVCAAPFRRR